MVVENNIKKNTMMFTKVSPYAISLANASVKYCCEFETPDFKCSLNIEIEKYHHNIVSLDKNIIIESDKVTILNSGQILYLDYAIFGIFAFQKISSYVHLNILNTAQSQFEGIFSGIDHNNQLVSGKIVMKQILIW